MHCSTDSQQTWLKPYIANLLQRYPESVISNVLAARQSFSAYQADPVGFCESTFGETYTDDVKAMMESVRDNPVTVAKSANATGKSQPVNTPVLTPEGFRPIGSLNVGDFVIGRNGKPTQVIGVYPQGQQPTLRITFNDGTSTLCSEDHLWKVRSSSNKYRLRPFKVVTAKKLTGILHRFLHIPMCDPVEFTKKPFSIDPYVMGVLIGDGTLGQYVRFDSADEQIVDEVRRRVPDADVKLYRKTHYGITTELGKCNPVLTSLAFYGLKGLSAAEKHIPGIYLYGSVEQRKALLAGLMDTDGSIDRNSYCTFDTVSPQLAKDFQSLIWSLGGTAKIKQRVTSFTHNGEKKSGALSYRIAVKLPFCPFWLQRKKNRWRDPETMQTQAHRLIKSIEPAGLTESVCIEVANEESLYLTESCIVTHNTHGAARVAAWFAKCFPDSQVYTAAAPPEDNLRRLLWGEIGNLVAKFPDVFSEFKQNVLHLERGPRSFLTGVTIPTSGDSAIRQAKFSGKHAPHILFILDEGDAIPDEVYKGIESCMSGGHFRLLVMFNPRSEAGPVYRMERDGLAHVVSLSAFHHPNVIEGRIVIPGGAVDRETTVRRINQWCRRLAANEPRDSSAEFFSLPSFLEGATARDQRGRSLPPLEPGWYKITNPAFSYMVLGQYPAQGTNQLISREWTEDDKARWDLYVSKFGEVPPRDVSGIMGFDIGEFGDDLSQALFRYGGYVERPTPETGWGGVDVIETGDKGSLLYHSRTLRAVAVDANGVGAGVAPHMRRLRCNAHGVKVQESPTELPAEKEIGEFKILRDQLWWSCREWLRADTGSMLPPDEELLEELHTATYEVKGKHIRVMDKDTFKELIKRSPNKADALCLTFAPIQAAPMPFAVKPAKKVRFAF